MSAADREGQDPLESLIARFLEAEKSGIDFDRDALIEEHPELADSLRDFFASHDRMKSAADVDPPTLPPRSSGPASEAPTIAPEASPLDDPTLPPIERGGDDPTLPPSEGASKTDEPTVGDKVRYFGDYELLEEIARGGMGVVYKARQSSLNRIVAIKMILAGEFAGQEDVRRFYTEAEAAAQLDHPGIVPIFEIGEHHGQHYFSMAYIDGESLALKVTDGPLPPREAAEMVKKICDAMAYAHDRGVIHRDLKPANILIDQNGQPKVTDFGLAKRAGADSDLTGTGQILGTPAYMPPEQASGKTDVGPLADVYSIGAILYCLLTGRPPFQAANPMDTLLQVLDREPVALRELNPAVPCDIETICLKCLEKEAERRYEGVERLCGDLACFINGEPISARPIGPILRFWRFYRPRVVTFAAGFAIFYWGFQVAVLPTVLAVGLIRSWPVGSLISIIASIGIPGAVGVWAGASVLRGGRLGLWFIWFLFGVFSVLTIVVVIRDGLSYAASHQVEVYSIVGFAISTHALSTVVSSRIALTSLIGMAVTLLGSLAIFDFVSATVFVAGSLLVVMLGLLAGSLCSRVLSPQA